MSSTEAYKLSEILAIYLNTLDKIPTENKLINEILSIIKENGFIRPN